VLLAGALGVLVVGILGVAGLAAYTAVTGLPVLEYVAAGVRYLLVPGALVLWLAAAGWGAMGTVVPARWRAVGLGRLVVGFVVLAVAGTAGVFWLEAAVGSGAQLLAATAVAELAGAVLGGAVAVRGLIVSGKRG
jgi:hypothetical protein